MPLPLHMKKLGLEGRVILKHPKRSCTRRSMAWGSSLSGDGLRSHHRQSRVTMRDRAVNSGVAARPEPPTLSASPSGAWEAVEPCSPPGTPCTGLRWGKGPVHAPPRAHARLILVTTPFSRHLGLWVSYLGQVVGHQDGGGLPAAATMGRGGGAQSEGHWSLTSGSWCLEVPVRGHRVAQA